MTDHTPDTIHFTAMVEEAMAVHGIDGDGATALRKIVSTATQIASSPEPLDPRVAGLLAASMHRGVKSAEASAQIIRAALVLVVSRAAADGLAREISPGIWHFGPEDEVDEAKLAVVSPAGSA